MPLPQHIRASLRTRAALAAATLALAALPALADAATCHVRWNGDYTVEGSCDWPCGYQVYGNVYVGPYVMNLPASCGMGINLAVQKITFTTGKMTLGAGAVAKNFGYGRYQLALPYSASASSPPNVTLCPAGTLVLNNAQSAFVAAGSPQTGVASSATAYCAYP